MYESIKVFRIYLGNYLIDLEHLAPIKRNKRVVATKLQLQVFFFSYIWNVNFLIKFKVLITLIK